MMDAVSDGTKLEFDLSRVLIEKYLYRTYDYLRYVVLPKGPQRRGEEPVVEMRSNQVYSYQSAYLKKSSDYIHYVASARS